MSTYYLIQCSEDGDVSVNECDVAELEKRLGDPEAAVTLSPKLPDRDPQYWGGKSVVIKGEIVLGTTRLNLGVERARAMVGAMEAFVMLSEVHEVKLVALVRHQPIEITCTPHELAALMQLGVERL